MQYIKFNELPLLSVFSKNGNSWIKQSSRTARIIKPKEHSTKWFYFRQSELCIVGLHSRLSSDYFKGA